MPVIDAAREAEVRARLRQIIASGDYPAEVVDLRAFEAPLPLERALELAVALPVGGSCMVRTPKMPRMLLPLLEKRGLHFTAESAPDGSALVQIERP